MRWTHRDSTESSAQHCDRNTTCVAVLRGKCSAGLAALVRHCLLCSLCFFFSSRRRHTRLQGDWSSDVCSSDLRFKASVVGDGITDWFSLMGMAPVPMWNAEVHFLAWPYEDPEAYWRFSPVLQEIGRASCRERV